MHISPTPLPGLFIITPRRYLDDRGFFVEAYNKRALAAAGIHATFVQDNVSASMNVGTLRGLHFQKSPYAQAKLVSVLKGSALDVVVDLRRNSPCFGQHFSIHLTATGGEQLFVPAGFAHGFITKAEDTIFAYKVSNYYSREHEAGIHFADPILAIQWDIAAENVLLSDRDQALPPFNPELIYFQ